MNDDELDDLLRDAAQGYNPPPETPREAMWERIAAARAAAGDPGSIPNITPRARTPWLRTAAGVAAVLALGIGIGRLTREPAAGDVTVSRVALSPDPVLDDPADAPAAAEFQEGAPEPRDPRGVTGDGPGIADGPTDGGAAPRVRRLAAGRTGGYTVRNRTLGRTYGVPRRTPGVTGEGTAMNAYRLAVVEHLARTEVLLVGFRSGTTSETAGAAATRRDTEQFGVLTRELLQNTRLLLATRATDDPTLTRLLEDLELVLMQIAQYATEGGARRGDLDAINQSLDRRNVLPKLRSNIPAGAPMPAGT